jgi:hypothetical protein
MLEALLAGMLSDAESALQTSAAAALPLLLLQEVPAAGCPEAVASTSAASAAAA